MQIVSRKKRCLVSIKGLAKLGNTFIDEEKSSIPDIQVKLSTSWYLTKVLPLLHLPYAPSGEKWPLQHDMRRPS